MFAASVLERALRRELEPTMAAQAMEAEEDSSVPATSSEEEDGSPRRKAVRRDDTNGPNASPGTESSIDGFRRQLGVGWVGVGGDGAHHAGSRGWARYIQNNYGLTNVQILAQSRAHGNAYLAQTAEGFYLFTEDLVQGTYSWSKRQCVRL